MENNKMPQQTAKKGPIELGQCQEDCAKCVAKCESRSIAIILPEYMWQLLEDGHDMFDISPGAIIRGIVIATMIALLEKPKEQFNENLKSYMH
jgi:hypothetical protein